MCPRNQFLYFRGIKFFISLTNESVLPAESIDVSAQSVMSAESIAAASTTVLMLVFLPSLLSSLLLYRSGTMLPLLQAVAVAVASADRSDRQIYRSC